MKLRGIGLVIISLALITMMTFMRGYRGIVQFMGKESQGDVLRYAPVDPRSTSKRGSDWIMNYSFTARDGVVYQGSKIFAPKARPKDLIKTVTVRYLEFSPNVTDVKGWISLTGVVGYAMAIFIALRAIPFLQTRTIGDEQSHRPAT